jgi:gamma-glutamyl-gamma-aminobutyrate hydrolase PuuD
MKILEVTPQGCAEVFKDWGEIVYDDKIIETHPEEIGLMVFTGGHDVWPELYGENVLEGTFFSIHRDFYEGKMFEKAQEHKIPCVGICRGAQFLCVKAGGKLVQDVTGHLATHLLRTSDNRTILSNSSHHQMQLPPKNAVPLAWSNTRQSRYYLNGDGDNINVDREYEVVYYPNINSLGIQGHPEWWSAPEEFIEYSKEVVLEYLFKGKKL